MAKISEWMPRVVFESFLIVVSILLALALDRWQEDLEIQELVNRSIQSFEQEVHQNKMRIEDVAPYHIGLQEVLMRLEEGEGVKSLTEYRNIMEGFQATLLLRTAWDTAVATGALSRMDYEMVAALSQTYDAQNRFNDFYSIGSNVILTSAQLNVENLDLSLYNAIRLMSEVTAAEAHLAAMYQVTLELIQEYKNEIGLGPAD